MYLIEKYKNKLTLTHAGGMWNITMELLSFLRSSPGEELILLDNYNNPIKVVRLAMLEEMTEKYEYIMQEWLNEYTQLAPMR
jgi:hypothetical protein